jgi:hypothetical protein
VHFTVREANSRETMAREKLVATGVAHRLVSLAVNLDDQALRGTEEVGDVRLENRLAAKFEAAELCPAKVPPEAFLEFRRDSAHLPCAFA